MKKLLMIIIFAIIPVIAYSQFNLGPKIGYNATTMKTDISEIKTDFQSGLQLGVFARFGGSWYVQPEIMYTQKGSIITIQDVDGSVKFNTVDIPIILGYKIINTPQLGVSLQAGPVASILTDKGIQDIGDVVKSAEYETLNWAVQAGIGVDLLMFTIDLRYEAGLNEVMKINQNDINSDFSLKNSRISLTVGWKLLGL